MNYKTNKEERSAVNTLIDISEGEDANNEKYEEIQQQKYYSYQPENKKLRSVSYDQKIIEKSSTFLNVNIGPNDLNIKSKQNFKYNSRYSYLNPPRQPLKQGQFICQKQSNVLNCSSVVSLPFKRVNSISIDKNSLHPPIAFARRKKPKQVKKTEYLQQQMFKDLKNQQNIQNLIKRCATIKKVQKYSMGIPDLYHGKIQLQFQQFRLVDTLPNILLSNSIFIPIISIYRRISNENNFKKYDWFCQMKFFIEQNCFLIQNKKNLSINLILIKKIKFLLGRNNKRKAQKYFIFY